MIFRNGVLKDSIESNQIVSLTEYRYKNIYIYIYREQNIVYRIVLQISVSLQPYFLLEALVTLTEHFRSTPENELQHSSSHFPYL